MKKQKNKSKKINKGAPSGLVVSLIFHATAFFIAGLFVVFTVVNKPEPEFEPPPPIQRPKMQLKKPKVKVRKSSQPKPSSRIVANVQTKTMPEIQLPDLMGTGESLLGGGTGLGGEFMDIPEIQRVSIMGTEESSGNDLVGTFYDFKRSRSGYYIDVADKSTYLLDVNKFIERGYDTSLLSRYYRSPNHMYAQCLVISPNWSTVGPSAFLDLATGDQSGGGYWMVHYKGKLVNKNGITFRFVCQADYFIVISVDGEVVWAGVWNTPDRYEDFQQLVGHLYSPRLDTRGKFFGNDRCMAGEWITLEPGVAKDIDILIGDENGECGWIIAVEEKGVEYETDKYGDPIYPIFRTAELSHDMLDQIYKDLPVGEVCCTNGPIFSDL